MLNICHISVLLLAFIVSIFRCAHFPHKGTTFLICANLFSFLSLIWSPVAAKSIFRHQKATLSIAVRPEAPCGVLPAYLLPFCKLRLPWGCHTSG